MQYDILFVGAGITAATACALLKDRYRICVIDVRRHIGGNCYDYQSKETYVHQYGPHIFHTKSEVIINFLSQYTEWRSFRYSVTAEIDDAGKRTWVPFPYSRQTANILAREYNESEILRTFFEGYSSKAWGIEYGSLPSSIKGRVPKDTQELSDYFPGQFQAIPKNGYASMIENMFDGVDMVLAVAPDYWYHLAKKASITCYAGRPDHIFKRNTDRPWAELMGIRLPYRSLNIEFSVGDWHTETVALNYCHTRVPWTRDVNYSGFTGPVAKERAIISRETPYQADEAEIAPFYPIPTAENLKNYRALRHRIASDWPSLYLIGRLGGYVYVDMDQAISAGLALGRRLAENLG